jgi:hypothetical protein
MPADVADEPAAAREISGLTRRRLSDLKANRRATTEWRASQSGPSERPPRSVLPLGCGRRRCL